MFHLLCVRKGERHFKECVHVYHILQVDQSKKLTNEFLQTNLIRFHLTIVQVPGPYY
jgi:hypothetical protein